jgi:CRISPR system Cascade subunit CasB
MNGFIEWLEGLNEQDTRARAVLRRSLAFEPGTFVPAYPYVEPFVKDEMNAWRREVFYLVAGLWAAHWRECRSGVPMPIGKACATFQTASGSTSAERRFITLLDADRDQLSHRLRQMIALLKDQETFGDGVIAAILLASILLNDRPRILGVLRKAQRDRGSIGAARLPLAD